MATAELVFERTESTTVAKKLQRHIPELDGLRGVAILLVMICHSAPWIPESTVRAVLFEGRCGVDLFFVLSGFLITGILLDTQGRPHALRNFYVRRGLRIWPLYFAFLFAALLLFRNMVAPSVSVLVYVLFAQNFFYLFENGAFLAPLWSLAVEEQFYLVWPWIALRAKWTTIVRICCAVLILSPVVRCAMQLAGAEPSLIYVSTFCRLDGIAMGGMIAAWMRSPDCDQAGLGWFVKTALWLGIAGVALSFILEKTFLFAEEFRYSFLALTFGGLLAATVRVQEKEARLAKMLRNTGLMGLGRISFAVYLFNQPLYTIMHGNHMHRLFGVLPASLSGIAVVAAANALLIGLAVCSWKLFESPMLRLKSRFAS